MSVATAELVGTGPLTRFTLRRDRIRIVIWIVAILLLDGREREGPLPDAS